MTEKKQKITEFYPYIIESAGVSRITIPKDSMDYAGWKTGDQLKVMAEINEKDSDKEKNKEGD